MFGEAAGGETRRADLPSSPLSSSLVLPLSFPPSSSLLIALIPYDTLSIVLSQYQPLPDIPNPVAAELVKANIYASSSSSDLAPDQRKALRVRGRIDFRRWAWVRVEGEETQLAEQKQQGSTSSLPPLDEKGERSRPHVASSASSSGTSKAGGSNFSHFDEKLSARTARRASNRGLGSNPSYREPVGEAEGRGAISSRGDAGFEIAEEKLGAGTYFLVVVRRGLVGLERFEEQAIY